jgi:uncharacterized protein YebE (UPF0316 family)
MWESLVLNPLFGYLFIFLARVADMSLDVLRLLMLTRGYAVTAAVVGFFEVTVFVVALGWVLYDGLNDPIKIIAYAGGFATGNLVGAVIEEKMAIGYVVIQVFPSKETCNELIIHLRENNYGVTRIEGEGRFGPRDILMVTTKRKNMPYIIKTIEQVAPETFFSISDIRSIHGGVFPRRRP